MYPWGRDCCFRWWVGCAYLSWPLMLEGGTSTLTEADNCFIRRKGVKFIWIWATNPLPLIHLRCAWLCWEIAERGEAAVAVGSLLWLSLHLGHELKTNDILVLLMAGGCPRQRKLGGSCQWQVCEP